MNPDRAGYAKYQCKYYAECGKWTQQADDTCGECMGKGRPSPREKPLYKPKAAVNSGNGSQQKGKAQTPSTER
ncbi:hypothetical protein AAFC00_001996 [Neodothiora populina]|uniref:Uncharacterized protein n=1 Tax=Neodothiora populina TaxID=2781224 RepID=A0ABR3PFY5_9PEZI